VESNFHQSDEDEVDLDHGFGWNIPNMDDDSFIHPRMCTFIYEVVYYIMRLS